MRNIGIAFLFSVFFLAFASLSIAQETPAVTSSSDTYIKEQYEFLKEQAISFDERVQRERESFNTMTGIVIGLIGLLFTATTAIGFVSYRATLKSIETKAEKKLEEKLETEMNSFNSKIESWAKETMFDSLGMSKKILFIAREQDHKDLIEKEMRLLKERGFSNVTLSTGYQDSNDLGMVVFCYNDDLDDILTATVAQVVSSQKEIPILGYYNRTIVNEALGRYDWKTYANSPLTLVSWVFTILSSSKKNI